MMKETGDIQSDFDEQQIKCTLGSYKKKKNKIQKYTGLYFKIHWPLFQKHTGLCKKIHWPFYKSTGLFFLNHSQI